MAKKKAPKTKKAAKVAKKMAVKKPRPKAQTLIGMEDSAIQPLEDVAEQYADIRDQRILLNKEESDLKATTIKLMRKLGKTIYRRNGVLIQIVDGDVSVKVKIAKPKDEDDVTVDLPEADVPADEQAVEQASDADMPPDPESPPF